MAITGVKTVTYRLPAERTLAECVTFFEEFGLRLAAQDGTRAEFGLPDGARVRLHTAAAASFATPVSAETVWGVSDADSLARVLEKVTRFAEPVQDAQGDWHFVAPGGLPMGLGLFRREAALAQPDALNAPFNVQRLNQWRKWRLRAMPRTINHVVYGVDDYKEVWDFFRFQLGFRLSDHSRGLGVFLRADGAHEHHNLFLANCHFRGPGQPSFQHLCLGVEDIDELMAGAMHMERIGHVSKFGVGRHRIASALFWYVDCPAGGEIEYGADTDYLDDGWIPREWEPTFGFISWCAKLAPFMRDEPAPDVRLLASEDDVRIPPLKAAAGKESA